MAINIKIGPKEFGPKELSEFIRRNHSRMLPLSEYLEWRSEILRRSFNAQRPKLLDSHDDWREINGIVSGDHIC